VHSDADHGRSVLTLAGDPEQLVRALLDLAREAVARIDVMTSSAGQHPHVGAVDVMPLVYLEEGVRGEACAAALAVGEELGRELALPVFLYGELTADTNRPARTRADLRRGGVAGLGARMLDEGLRPDFGPRRLHPTAGAVLLAARPVLVAFNLQLAAPAGVEDARRIAAAIREGGADGLPGLRAIGVMLGDGRAQVSMNVERPLELTLARVVEAVRAHAELDSAELVGLAPAASFADFPADLPIPGFDERSHLIENALG